MITVAQVSDVAHVPLAGFIMSVAQVSDVAHGPFVLHLLYFPG